MPNVLTCLAQEHDPRLVVLAGLVCLFACYTAFNLLSRSRGADSRADRWLWLTGAAAVAGCGVWATHFVAMLAYRPGLPLGYDLGLTMLSVAAAAAIIWLGGWAAMRPTLGWAAFGGGVAGAGIGAMHYLGMAAMQVPAEIVVDATAVGVSLALGVGLGACAFVWRAAAANWRGDVGAGAVFAAAILSLHFTAMSAVTLIPNMELAVPDRVTAPEWLAVAVTAVTLAIIVLSLAGSVVDQHLAERKAQETERLRRHVAELQESKRELEATGADLRTALDSAAASNRAKSQFLATMSHELRTPLNSVIGFAELLGVELHGPMGDARYRDYASSIRDSGAHLLALINDVLDFAKIDAGRLELAEEEIDIGELFEASLRMVKSAADEAGLALHKEIAEGELLRLRGDHRRVKQVLLNLLSNAIKFTPGPGTVTISAGRQGGRIVITVADTGIGIAADDLHKALEPFGQIDNRLARAYEGTGLGLPLSKQLMALHGGSLRLDSVPGAGTTVTLSFPAERVLPLGLPCEDVPVRGAADLLAVLAFPRSAAA
jgi:signal transduction histidine kinase